MRLLGFSKVKYSIIANSGNFWEISEKNNENTENIENSIMKTILTF